MYCVNCGLGELECEQGGNEAKCVKANGRNWGAPYCEDCGEELVACECDDPSLEELGEYFSNLEDE